MLKLAILRVWNYCIIKIMKNKGKKMEIWFERRANEKGKRFFHKGW